MKNILIRTSVCAICVLFAAFARGGFVSIHTLSMMMGVEFVQYEKLPGAAPLVFTLEHTDVSVYELFRNKPVPPFNVGNWDGESLNTPGMYGPIPYAEFEAMAPKMPPNVKAARRYMVLVSHPLYPDWFAVAAFENAEAVLYAAGAVDMASKEAKKALVEAMVRNGKPWEKPHEVPEPASAALALAGLALLFGKRKRKTR